MHSIHGRAPAIATGLSVTRPGLSVWVITGDEDALSIGGNHLIHALRRNVNLKILLFNNQIYGLTKAQYSPTSELGKITKSTPMGSLDQPVQPGQRGPGGGGDLRRPLDRLDRAHLTEVLRKAAAHKGTAFVEIYQNCNIFNDGAFDLLKEPDTRADNQIRLEHGKPIRFGADGERGVRLTDDCRVELVEVADVGTGRAAGPRRAPGRAEPGLHALPAVPRRRRADPDRGVPRRRAARCTTSSCPSSWRRPPAGPRRPGQAAPRRDTWQLG